MTIDWWTLGFQTVNVAILIWLLGHFFWKPVAAMIEARRAATQKLTDEAGEAKFRADGALADVERTRAGFTKEREAILAAAHKDADAAYAARLAEAGKDIAVLESAAKASIDKAKAAEGAMWADRSSDLAVSIARKLATRLDGAAVEACFLDWLVAEIGKLPEPTRAAAGAKGASLEATTAIAADGVAQERIITSIGKALGGTPKITFKTDQALLAGIELCGDHLIVNSSWRADLAAIRAGLTAGAAA